METPGTNSSSEPRGPASTIDPPDLATVQVELETRGIDRDDLHDDPMVQLRRWFDHARSVGVHQPEAMAVASADPNGVPSVRLVLLRGLESEGVTFFTNYESRKGVELTANPHAAIVFPWHQVSRQVRVVGTVHRVAGAESDQYFATRPRGSQVSAWASPQSRPVADRHALEELREQQEAVWQDREVDRPPHWGGFRIVPAEVEFWQGRANRYHDRFRYRRGEPAGWIIERLGP